MLEEIEDAIKLIPDSSEIADDDLLNLNDSYEK